MLRKAGSLSSIKSWRVKSCYTKLHGEDTKVHKGFELFFVPFVPTLCLL